MLIRSVSSIFDNDNLFDESADQRSTSQDKLLCNNLSFAKSKSNKPDYNQNMNFVFQYQNVFDIF